MPQLEPTGLLEAEFLLPLGPPAFLVRSATDGMRPTHFVEGNLLYSRSADVNVCHV